jgi:hypothetical protein
MKRDLEEQRRRASAGQPAAEKSPIPAVSPNHPQATAQPQAFTSPQAAPESDGTPPQTDAEKTKELEQEEKFNLRKKALEEDLEAVMTPEDIKSYIFKGRLAKEVTLFSGQLKATFQSLNPTEWLEVDKRVATYRNEGVYTEAGISNQRTIVMLSHAWTHADGKPLSAQSDPAVREKHIRKLANFVVNRAAAAFNNIEELTELALYEKKFIKK